MKELNNVKCPYKTECSGPDPEERNTGGIECRWYDVSGVSREGGEYERGISPLSFRGSGKIWKVVVPEKRF